MINNTKLILIILIFNILIFFQTSAREPFIFDVTEIQITNNGNTFEGIKRGEIKTSDNLIIKADNFTYQKNENTINATGNVIIVDKINKYTIFSEYIFYNKNSEEIFSKGKTKINLEPKYIVSSSNIYLDRNNLELFSKEKASIKSNKGMIYEFSDFRYLINQELLKAQNIYVISNLKKNSKDKNNEEQIYFSEGFFNLKENNFIAKKTKIYLDKNSYDNVLNDPRLLGASSYKKNNITQVKKGIFTSCSLDHNCPPWAVRADKITHDLNKKQLIYDNAFLEIYGKKILYFPKFFHPDPTVDRQSGFLKPSLNRSDILGSSMYLPYYKVLSDNKDITFKPTIFDSKIVMFQNEYRQENEKSSFVADIGITKGYQSNSSSKKNSLTHIFSKFNKDLNLENFINSKFNLFLEKTSNDTYLKVFEGNLANLSDLETNNLKPQDSNSLNSGIELYLEHQNYTFSTGINVYEDLQKNNNDRYQFVAPYYNYNKQFLSDNINFGIINFGSSGSNTIFETNKVKSNITNDISFNSNDFISNQGIKNNFNIYFKNLNSLGKNDPNYKSSTQVELMNIIEMQSSFPLIKINDEVINLLTPIISARFNPSDMKDYSNTDRTINSNNIFDVNRLGISDSFESGKSLTIGLNYSKENLDDINNYFEMKLGTVFRDKIEKNIPTKSSINQKSSNLFGNINKKFSKNLKINYNFSIDNNYQNIEQQSFNLNYNNKFLDTTFNFVEENDKMGDANIIENITKINFNENNFLTFSTRKNRKINLTEYYDLIYEYKNDCLVAGIKYKKSYYEDRDLKPTEDLLFTITLYPLTTFEQEVDQNLYRN